jgi:hypothetical protein
MLSYVSHGLPLLTRVTKLKIFILLINRLILLQLRSLDNF